MLDNQTATKEEAEFIRSHADDVRLEKPDWSALPPPTAEEAAHIIAPHWDSEPEAGAPEDQHKWLFLREVCHRLGREPNPINIEHAARLMDKMGIPLHTGHEYPKAVYGEPDEFGRPVALKYPPGHPKNGQDVVFANAEEEAAFSSRASPRGAKADGKSNQPQERENGRAIDTAD